MEMVVVEFQCCYKYRPEERKALIVSCDFELKYFADILRYFVLCVHCLITSCMHAAGMCVCVSVSHSNQLHANVQIYFDRNCTPYQPVLFSGLL